MVKKEGRIGEGVRERKEEDEGGEARSTLGVGKMSRAS